MSLIKPVVGSSLMASDGVNLALLHQLSQGTARWCHWVWPQGKKGKLNQAVVHQPPVKGICSACYCSSAVSLQLLTDITQTSAPVLWSCSFKQKHPQVEREGGGSAVLHSAGSCREEGMCPASCQISHSTQANCTHTSLSKKRQQGDAGTASSPTRTLSAGAQGSQGCPWLSGSTQKLLQPRMWPPRLHRACAVRWAELKAFSILSPMKFLPAKWVSDGSCSQHCCFCTLWNSCQNI